MRERRGDKGPSCPSGSPIKCDLSVVRLTHIDTGKNLRLNPIRSQLRSGQEVSAHGEEEEGGGDADEWRVLCDAEFWQRGDGVRFQHTRTSQYLSSSSSAAFTDNNCPHCPVVGHLEAYGSPDPDRRSVFVADQGIFLSRRREAEA